MRYKISDTIQFLNIPVSSQNVAAGGRILLKDGLQERQFIINSTTQLFIEKFNTPKSFAQINKEIAIEANANEQELKKVINPFFNYIKYRRFIVPENYKAVKTNFLPLLQPGVLYDGYKIEFFLGVNDDVEVYKAIDIKTKDVVVIKFLKSTEKRKTDEFAREFNFLKTLQTSLIVPITYSFKTKPDLTYFVQEFVDGLSLPQFIRRKKTSSQELVFGVAAKIAEAFKEIHFRNIVHGDIHASNIIVTPENNIKIIDFGLAIHTGLDNNELVNFGGAYFFMPPERIKKTTRNKFTRQPDFYSDVFQIGVVLYMLLYDEYPFNGITWEELATEIKEKPVAFPETSHFNFRIPGWLKDTVTKCVAKKARQRFSDATELYHALSKNLNDDFR